MGRDPHLFNVFECVIGGAWSFGSVPSCPDLFFSLSSDAAAAPEAEEVPLDGDPAEWWIHLGESGLGSGETGAVRSHQQRLHPGRDD